MYAIARAFLFLYNPEKAHYVAASLIRFVLKIPGFKWIWKKRFTVSDPLLEKELMGIRFPNPVGLAAGFDKNAAMFSDLRYCGFGFIEIGTLTPLAQPGNEKPRLFRLKADEAVINRMGFNNDGVEIAVEKLKNRDRSFIIGGNIGKNKVTANEDAPNDYRICFEALFPVVDYFVVNVSSPNTPNLRELQDKKPLTELLNGLQDLNRQKEKPKPILLKIAPDLTNEQLDDIISIVEDTKIEGVIATNTTISRAGLRASESELEAIGAGGLSGKPLTKRSTEVVRYLSENRKAYFVIIGVGGIHSAEDAIEKLDAGADLIQLYTGFIYEGPALVKRINKAILNRLKTNA